MGDAHSSVYAVIKGRVSGTQLSDQLPESMHENTLKQALVILTICLPFSAPAS